MRILERAIKPNVVEALSDTPVVCLLGPRQSGKSTLCQSLGLDRLYITLDDLDILAQAKLDPVGFIQSLQGNVIIDEIQRCPELILSIKAEVDKNRIPGRFLLTGSANLLLLPQIKESLAGRVEIIYLSPLSEAEKEETPPRFLKSLFANKFVPKITGRQDPLVGIAERLCRGGYPEPNTRTEARAKQWFAQYLKTIVQSDVRDIAKIRNEDDMMRLVEALALRTGNILNVNALSNELQITRTVLERYLSILEHVFLFYRLPAWHSNQSKRLTKAPKVHVVDSGLGAFLNRLSVADWHDFSSDFGGLLETFVLQQIRSEASLYPLDVTLSHYRDKDKYEVDIVIEHGRDIYGVEIKKAMSVNAKDFKGLARLQQVAGERFKQGVVLYCGNNTLKAPVDNCIAMPINELWH